MTACQAFLGPEPDISPRGIFDRIWTDFNETYALFEERGINWNEVKDIYSPQISPDMGNFELFRVCANMLNTLNDPHVYFVSPFGHSKLLYYDFEDREPFSLDIIRGRYLEDGGKFAGDWKFLYGIINESKSKRRVGYIYIREFSGDFEMKAKATQSWAKKINDIITELGDTDYLVLDVRSNTGGLGSNMNYIAGRFASVKKDYMKVSTKNGPGRNDFSDPITFAIKPAITRYTRPIALLTNRETVSAAEWFTVALRTQKHITQVGETTNGAFSPRLMRPLINGWMYTISIQKVKCMDGKCYEGIGITPNEEHIISNTWEDLYSGLDTQLEYALSLY